MQLKFAIVWMSLFVLSALASEQESYNGDLGELILELILAHTQRSLSYRDLCICSGVNKKLANVYLSSKAYGLQETHNSLKKQIKQKHPNVGPIVLSPQVPAAGYAYENDKKYKNDEEYKYAYYVEFARFNSKGKLETKKVGIKSLGFRPYVHKPTCINGTFCFLYRYKGHFPEVIYIDVLGKECEHPFGPEIMISDQEKKAIKNYLYSDSARNEVWDIEGLGAKSQYKLANLLARYASSDQMSLYVNLCCGKKKKHFSGLGTLRYSVVRDSMFFEGSEINAHFTSAFGSATKEFIQKFFVAFPEGENPSAFKKWVKEWAACIDYLKNQRMFIKRLGNSIIIYDHLSSTARVILYEKKYGVRISKLVPVRKNADITTLEYTDDKRLKYHYLGSAEDELSDQVSSFLDCFFPPVQHKKWIFSKRLKY